jgi:hypothetical protein
VAAAVLLAVGCQSATAGNQSCPAVLTACPAAAPAQGTQCTGSSSQIWCEYGSDPNSDCNTIAYCTSSGWQVSAAGDLNGDQNCPTVLTTACPATFATAANSGDVCTAIVNCQYPEGLCVCDQVGGALECTASAAGCPATRPLAGTSCNADLCGSWGAGTCDGQSMICYCGLWQPFRCYG